ncbi:RNase adapter RapZ [Rhodobacterales bacterium HKCCSP123]|nr:RNase adapter RapZ [Rhodobacterales bacterium HKCCSP123]
MQSHPQTPPAQDRPPTRVIFVTGPSGAGRSTAINALEDLGFEAIDNLPLSLLPRLLEGPPPDKPLALGTDARNRDYSATGLVAAVDRLAGTAGYAPDLLYLDCAADVLQRRYSETRRRHPLAPDADPAQGIAQELALLGPVRARATVLIDTSALTPHDLRAEITRLFAPEGAGRLAITVTSFSYRRGLPTGADLVFDCRFLRNPHWDPALKPQDGRAPGVQAYIAADDRFAPFRDKVTDLADLLLPAFEAEGKSHLTIAFGCTGGQHRSVAMTEILAAHLAEAGWPVSKRHREVEQRRLETGGAADRPEATDR